MDDSYLKNPSFFFFFFLCFFFFFFCPILYNNPKYNI